MPSVSAAFGTREIPIEVGVHSARNVQRAVLALAPRGLIELESTIDDCQIGILEPIRERRRVHERAERHESYDSIDEHDKNLMARSAELHKLTGIATRLGAFVAERHPLAL